MKDICFSDYMSLACDMADEFDDMKDEFSCVCAIAKFDEASEIISALLCLGYPIASVEIHSVEFDGYADEYIVSLNADGVWCEPFKRDGKYINDDGFDLTYVSDNANHKCLNNIHSPKIIFSVVDDEEDDDCDFCDEFDYDFNGELNCGLDDCEYLCDCCEDSDSFEDIEHHIFRNDNGDIDGFKKVISEYTDGYYSQYSYSYFDDCSDAVKKLAKEFGFRI